MEKGSTIRFLCYTLLIILFSGMLIVNYALQEILPDRLEIIIEIAISALLGMIGINTKQVITTSKLKVKENELPIPKMSKQEKKEIKIKKKLEKITKPQPQIKKNPFK